LTNHDGLVIGRFCEVLTPKEAESTRNTIFENVGKSTRQASGVGSNNIATDGINITLYEATFRDQDDWFMAQALHIFPLVFRKCITTICWHRAMMKKPITTLARVEQLFTIILKLIGVDHKFQQPIVQKVIRLMEIRNNHPAFDGDVSVIDNPDDTVLHLLRSCQGVADVQREIDMHKQTVRVRQDLGDDNFEVLFEG